MIIVVVGNHSAEAFRHNGATSRGTARRGEEIVLDNLRRFVSAAPPRNVVDKAAGY
jgi:hypothetical protein